MKTKLAKNLTESDTLIRFGHHLKVKAANRRIHPLLNKETISVDHENGKVDYTPDCKVQVA